jgi:hypothetical protein
MGFTSPGSCAESGPEQARTATRTATARISTKDDNGKTLVQRTSGKDQEMIGPFCQWRLEIPATLNKELNVNELKSKVEFEGTMRAFVGAET